MIKIASLVATAAILFQLSACKKSPSGVSETVGLSAEIDGVVQMLKDHRDNCDLLLSQLKELWSKNPGSILKSEWGDLESQSFDDKMRQVMKDSDFLDALKTLADRCQQPEIVNLIKAFHRSIGMALLAESDPSSRRFYLKVPPEIELPPSNSEILPHPSIQVAISPRAVLVNSVKVADLKNGRIGPEYKQDHSASAMYIVPLAQALASQEATDKKQVEKPEKDTIEPRVAKIVIAEDGRRVSGEAKTLTLVADRRSVYKTITEVLYTLGRMEYGDVKLAVAAQKGAVRIINVNLPRKVEAADERTLHKSLPGEGPPVLNLMVGITLQGFFVYSSAKEAPQRVSIPLLEKGQECHQIVAQKAVLPTQCYDTDRLNQEMGKIKQAFPQETKMILFAAPETSYEVLVKVMDACRGSGDRELFFDVILSAGID